MGSDLARRRRLIVGAGLAALSAGLCDAGAVPPRPSVLLVTIDTLRADRAQRPDLMPHLSRLATGGVRFTGAHGQVPLTLPAHATLFTSRDLLVHGVRDNVGSGLGPGLPTLAERFAAGGFSTAAFIGGSPLVRAQGLARGFARYDDTLDATPLGEEGGQRERRAEDVVTRAAGWVASQRGRPFFLWVHLFDPHTPYDPPPRFRRPGLAAYDGEVAYADEQLGRLLQEARSHAGPAGVWVLVASDHGESLGDHGEATHGIFLYGSTLRLVMVLAPPVPVVGRESRAPASLLDVAPTLLDAASLPPLPEAQGRSLLPTLSGADPAALPGPLYLESVHGRRRYGWAVLTGLLDGSRKLIAGPRRELYDLSSDPLEQRDLAATSPELVLALARRMEETRSRTSAPPTDPVVDRETLERLGSLGYVGGTAGAVHEERLRDRPRPDPGDRIAALEPLERGLKAVAERRPESARADLERVLEIDPDNLVALNNLGILALGRGSAREAERWFRRGLQADRFADNLANNLGLALARQGRHGEAVKAYDQALEANPGFTAARFNMALAHLRLGDRGSAGRELDRVRREDPGFPGLQAALEAARGGP